MSQYLKANPEEAYFDEVATLMNAFRRRKTPWWLRFILLKKTYCIYIYRRTNAANKD